MDIKYPPNQVQSERSSLPNIHNIFKTIARLQESKEQNLDALRANMEHMTEDQTAAYWTQVFSFSFLNHGVDMPNDPLAEPSDSDGEEELPNAPKLPQLTQQQKLVVENFALQVLRHGKLIPVPKSVKDKVRTCTGLDLDALKNYDSSAHMLASNIPTCNCPYCWVYTEDLAWFMEHLWEQHTIRENDNERKDSGYDDTMNVDVAEGQEEDINTHEEVMSWQASGHSNSSTETGAESISPTTTIARSDLFHTKGRAGSKKRVQTQGFITQFWASIVAPPLLSGNKDILARPDSGRAAKAQRLADWERHAQQVRDNMEPIPWFDPYIRSPSGKSRQQVGETKSADASQARQEEVSTPSRSSTAASEPSDTDTDEVSEDSSEQRYWICPHDDECKQKFDSLVLFVEHLSQKGLIVHKKATAPRLLPSLNFKDLRERGQVISLL